MITGPRARRAPRVCSALALIVIAGAPLGAQESLSAARDLYASASYDEALAMLNRLQPAGDAADDRRAINQYRAFCLLALGRVPEAERAIEAVVAAQPSYHPSDDDASPRLRATFGDVRRRLLPGIIQQRYAGAKASFERKDYSAAAEGFGNVVDLLADPDVAVAASQPPLSDLRTLAAGFRDLSVGAAAPPQRAAAAPGGAPLPDPLPEPPRPAPPALPAVFGATDANVVPPTVVRQGLPPLPSIAFKTGEGLLAVVVDEKGGVESVSMLESVHPTFDGQIVEAARAWRYKPATLNGVPVRFRRIVQIKLAPDR